jgi:uncharacterized membrane protein
MNTALRQHNYSGLNRSETAALEVAAWTLVGAVTGGAAGKMLGFNFFVPAIVGGLLGAVAFADYGHPGRRGAF